MTMRAHKLIEWLENEPDHRRVLNDRENYRKRRDKLTEMIQASVKFDLGYIEELPMPKEGEAVIEAERLFPANPFLFQTFVKEENLFKDPDMEYVEEEDYENVSEGMYLYVLGYGYPDEGLYVLEGFQESPGFKTIIRLGSLTLDNSRPGMGRFAPLNNEEGWIKRNLVAVYSLTLSAYKVMSCCNIYKEKEEAPAKLNKKRAKKGKPLIDEYYTLSIGRVNSKGECVPIEGESKGTRKLHFCRGFVRHLKTKDTWVRGYWRGNKAKGIIIKDYQLEK